jgi:hypothetical protein
MAKFYAHATTEEKFIMDLHDLVLEGVLAYRDGNTFEWARKDREGLQCVCEPGDLEPCAACSADEYPLGGTTTLAELRANWQPRTL